MAKIDYVTPFADMQFSLYVVTTITDKNRWLRFIRMSSRSSAGLSELCTHVHIQCRFIDCLIRNKVTAKSTFSTSSISY